MVTFGSPRWGPSVPTFRNWKFFAMATRGSQQERAVACNGNLWFPGCEPCVPTSETRQFLAIVTCGSHVGSREFQPLGPSSSLPSSQTQTFRYRSIKQNKRFCYRLRKQNKTTLRTMSSNFLQSTDPSTGNVTFSGLEPWVSSFRNRQFLTMIVA